jgi:penicillin-binding protein 2
MYGQTYHCWKKKGHGFVSLRNAMKQSCDTYFYEVARKLGVDKLSETAKKFGLGEKVFGDLFSIEKKGLIPNTQWKKNALGKGWLLGETIITGIGQGYIQTTPIQLCLMTAQIANGGYKIYPQIVVEDNKKNQPEDKFTPLYENSKNIRIVQDAMFGSTNEVMGTSYRSRIDDLKYQFAGKTGTAQVKKITEQERELDLKTFEIPYEQRDHALYVAFGPYENPRYALSVIVEHGGNGSTTAAPMAKKLFKLIIDRHQLRTSMDNKKYLEV